MKWLPYVVAAALVALAVFLWNREHRLRTSAEREKEAVELTLNGQLVETQGTKAALADAVDGLTAQNSELQAALAEAKKAASDAKVVTVVKLDTGSLSVKNVPRPGHGTSDSTSPPLLGQGTNGCPAPVGCILAFDDKLSVQVDALELQTRKGNVIVVGTADVYRTEPPPKTKIASGRFQTQLSSAQSLVQPQESGLGVFAIGACGKSGCGPGGGLLLPPFTVPLLGTRVEPILGVVAAPGEVLVAGGLGFRF